MVTWMAYAAVVAGLLAAGGLALERICEALGWPRRLAWLAVLTLAVAIPLTARPPETVAGGGNAGEPMATVVEQVSLPEAGTPTARERSGAGDGDTNPAPADRAALFVWSLATLATLALLGSVVILSSWARRRWKRRWIGGEEVYVSREFGPALVGLARPAVVIPRWVLKLGAAVSSTAVKHEREHARAGDHVALLYAGLVAAAFPWSPAIWWMCRRLRTAVEIDCDRRVIRSGIPAAEYGSLLLGIGTVRPRRQVFALTLAGSESQLEQRLKAMVETAAGTGNGRKQMKKAGVVLLAALAVGTVTIACDVPPPTAIAPAVNEVLGAAVRTDQAAEQDPSSREFEVEEGRVVIRGVHRLPSVSLPVRTAAANPLVLIDGVLLEGGLSALLAREPLDIQGIGYSDDPGSLGDFDDQNGRGIVLIHTAKGTTGQEVERMLSSPEDLERGMEALERVKEAWQIRTEDWESRQGAWERRKDAWERRTEGLQRRVEEWTRQAEVNRDRIESTTQTAPRDPAIAEEAGWVIIRDINGKPRLWLSPASVAANPRVVIDGVVLEGGLDALLKGEPLHMERFGYLGPERGVFIITKR